LVLAELDCLYPIRDRLLKAGYSLKWSFTMERLGLY